MTAGTKLMAFDAEGLFACNASKMLPSPGYQLTSVPWTDDTTKVRGRLVPKAVLTVTLYDPGCVSLSIFNVAVIEVGLATFIVEMVMPLPLIVSVVAPA